MDKVDEVREKYKPLIGMMNERVRRIWAATEAKSLGWGGVSTVAQATGLSRTTITSGLHEVKRSQTKLDKNFHVRHQGGGRKRLTETDRKLRRDLEALLETNTRGDPESLLHWTCKSTVKLAEELNGLGHKVSQRSVVNLLHEMLYSLQGNAKTIEGSQHPDRNAQFGYINQKTQEFVISGQPVISVDTKKKELIGRFKNNGQEWRPKGEPEKVKVHDFIDLDAGKAIPYGIYDVAANNGWVSVGIDHDTAEFAVESIRRWWRQMGRLEYPDATELLIMADAGGSNSSRSRLWKVALQKLANDIKLEVNVCHFPPGTSKWNKIEHRMFSHITQNWRGRPLTSQEVVVNLIGHTTTKEGLRIKAKIDKNSYEIGLKVSNREFKNLNLEKDDFHGEWNYKLLPKPK